MRKKIFCAGKTRAAKAAQTSLLPARQAQRTNQGGAPFICTLWVPIHLSFNSQQGQPLCVVPLSQTVRAYRGSFLLFFFNYSFSNDYLLKFFIRGFLSFKAKHLLLFLKTSNVEYVRIVLMSTKLCINSWNDKIKKIRSHWKPLLVFSVDGKIVPRL